MPPKSSPSRQRVDFVYRQLYRAAYMLMRFFWFVFRPQTRGVNVALWYEDELIVVKNSYRPGYALPGGYIRPRENARAAAVREISEELQVTIEGADLYEWGQLENRVEFKRDRVTLFEVQCAVRPVVRIDNREVVAVRFLRPEAAGGLRKEVTLAAYLKEKGSVRQGRFRPL